MILDTEEAEDRLSSADNLLNRLNLISRTSRKSNAMQETFGISEPSGASIPTLPPSSDELIDDIDAKIDLGLTYNGAARVMRESVEMLSRNLINIDPTKPERLARIATDMNKIVSGINEVRNGGKSGNGSVVIVYKPIMQQENTYEVIQAHE